MKRSDQEAASANAIELKRGVASHHLAAAALEGVIGEHVDELLVEDLAE